MCSADFQRLQGMCQLRFACRLPVQLQVTANASHTIDLLASKTAQFTSAHMNSFDYWRLLFALTLPNSLQVAANASHHADLLAAMRGGGTLFGVITQLAFRAVDVSDYKGGVISYADNTKCTTFRSGTACVTCSIEVHIHTRTPRWPSEQLMSQTVRADTHAYTQLAFWQLMFQTTKVGSSPMLMTQTATAFRPGIAGDMQR